MYPPPMAGGGYPVYDGNGYPEVVNGFPRIPFNGPPPKPPHIRVNPQDWQNGSWSMNPAFYQSQWSSSFSGNVTGQTWVPSETWDEERRRLGLPNRQMKPRRYVRPPSADYLATKLSDNPLGLSNMIPREVLYGPTNEEGIAPPTPWIWNPRGLDADETSEDSSSVGALTPWVWNPRSLDLDEDQAPEAHEQLPSSLFIRGVNDHDEHPTFGGGFGDVYRASYQGQIVALKRIRTFTADSTSHHNRLQFCKEALVWQGLRHRFILPLIGIDRETFSPSFCMVSPWMKYGTVLKYLRDRGRGNVDRLLLEIAQGLEYLHSLNIVHGDLRGSNILVSDEGNACLSDFGLATTISDADSTTGLFTSSSNHGGSLRWFAPELIQPKSFGCERFSRTPASDVYAYGCVCLELYTGSPPFAHVTPDVAAMFRVIAGDRPEQPTTMSAPVWELVTATWAPNSRSRPNIHDLVVAFPALI
ncbi:kinase-like domain-containing protein [Mycena epipterygia]|nr:kinase-like domain-containing protein [Mycena epipterygia]